MMQKLFSTLTFAGTSEKNLTKLFNQYQSLSSVLLTLKYTKGRKIIIYKLILKANGVSVDLLGGTAKKDSDGLETIKVGDFQDNTEITVNFGVLAMTTVPKAIFVLSQTNPNKSYQVVPKDPSKTKKIKAGELWEDSIKYKVQ